MIVAMLMGALEVAAPVAGIAGGIGVRAYAARKARNAIHRELEPQIEQFRQDNTYTAPLEGDEKAAAESLLAFIRQAQAMRANVIEATQDIALPDADISLIPKLQADMIKIQINFLAVMKEVTGFKFLFVARDQLKERLQIANGWPIHPLHVSGVDKIIIDAMDHLHVLDAAQHVGQFANDTLSHVFGHHEDIAGMIFNMPLQNGFISMGKTLLQEYNWLMNDESSFADSFRYGAVPALLRTKLKAIGLAIDIGCGWATLGIPTMAATILGRVLSKEHLKADLGKEYNRLNERVEKIRDRQTKASRKITGAQNEFRHEFVGEIKKCPDVGDTKILKDIVIDLQAGFNEGMVEANLKTANNMCEAKKKSLKPTRLQKILGVDPNVEATRLYDSVARELQSRNLGNVHYLSMAAQDHAEEAVLYILKHGMYKDERSQRAAENLKAIATKLPTAYAKNLSHWQQGCLNVWEVGVKNIADITKREHEEISAVAEREETIMKPIRRNIRKLQRRLGIKNLMPE